MLFDIIIREAETEEKKPVLITCRVHDVYLSKFVREVQTRGKFVYGIIPLFRSKAEEQGN